jgi:hypothetical protein
MIGAIVAKKKAKSAFEAFNKRDIHSFIASWSKDATFTFPGNLSASGTINGIAEIERWFSNYLQQFPRFTFSLRNICVKRILDVSGSNVVSVEWDYSGENVNGKTIKNSGVTVIEISGMKAIRVQDYIHDHEELRKAWEE